MNSITLNHFKYFSLIILSIYLTPNILHFLFETKYLVHDNLNSNVVWYKNIGNFTNYFASNEMIIPNGLGGLPRFAYPSGLNLTTFLYLLFDSELAFNINYILVHIVAFIGMLNFSRYCFNLDKNYSYIAALLFSILPFWTQGGIGVAGLPLIFWAFWSIYKKENTLFPLLVICLFPLFSSLIFTNLFTGIFISLILIFLIIRDKTFHFNLILSLSLFTIISCLTEFRLLYSILFTAYDTSRDNISVPIDRILSKPIWLKNGFTQSIRGQYHVPFFAFPFLIMIVIAGFIYAKRNVRFLIISLISLILIFGLLWSLKYLDIVLGAKLVGDVLTVNNDSSLYKLLSFIQPRFYILQPLLWFTCVIISMKVILSTSNQYKSALMHFCIIGQVLISFFMPSYFTKDYQNSSGYYDNSFYATFITSDTDNYKSYDEYFQSNEFDKFKKTINYSNDYIACLGIDSEIAQFNSINTIGGYHYFFPVSKKKSLLNLYNPDVRSTITNSLYVGPRIRLDLALVLEEHSIVKLNFDLEKLKTQYNCKYLVSDMEILGRMDDLELIETQTKLYFYLIK